MNLIESLQLHFGYEPLQKIDPNTQTVADADPANPSSLGQAAIPVVLIGLNRYTASDEGATFVLNAPEPVDWINVIYASDAGEVTTRVAAYASMELPATYKRMNEIAAKAVMLVQHEAGTDNPELNVKKVMESQVHNVLTYLPASLHLGNILDDTTLDDRTHKMEGPISSIMQAISSGFNNADEDERKNKTQ